MWISHRCPCSLSHCLCYILSHFTRFFKHELLFITRQSVRPTQNVIIAFFCSCSVALPCNGNREREEEEEGGGKWDLPKFRVVLNRGRKDGPLFILTPPLSFSPPSDECERNSPVCYLTYFFFATHHLLLRPFQPFTSTCLVYHIRPLKRRRYPGETFQVELR